MSVVDKQAMAVTIARARCFAAIMAGIEEGSYVFTLH